MGAKVDTPKDVPYVVEDPEVLKLFKRELLGTAEARVHDVAEMLRQNPGKPIAIPKAYLAPTAFVTFNKQSTDSHIMLRNVNNVKSGKESTYYAFLKDGRKARRLQKRKRLEQARQLHPEDFPEPELVDEPA